jgi:hypothetical protein
MFIDDDILTHMWEIKIMYRALGEWVNVCSHREIFYFIETKAKCCHPHFGQFLVCIRHGGGGAGKFCRFKLIVKLNNKVTINN